MSLQRSIKWNKYEIHQAQKTKFSVLKYYNKLVKVDHVKGSYREDELKLEDKQLLLLP